MLFNEQLKKYFDRLSYKYVLDTCMLVLCKLFVTILRINGLKSNARQNRQFWLPTINNKTCWSAPKVKGSYDIDCTIQTHSAKVIENFEYTRVLAT